MYGVYTTFEDVSAIKSSQTGEFVTSDMRTRTIETSIMYIPANPNSDSSASNTVILLEVDQINLTPAGASNLVYALAAIVSLTMLFF